MFTAHALAALLATASTRCDYDRTAMLALDQRAFDQDMEGGWRRLARDPACRIAAADLIRAYREAHGPGGGILYWHEGQLRAGAGQTEAAIALFHQSRNPDDPFGWDHYVDASIAFLRRDRAALLAARDALARLPRPSDFEPRDPQGRPIQLAWPPNLNVVDALVACFGRPYEEAYDCRPEPAR